MMICVEMVSLGSALDIACERNSESTAVGSGVTRATAWLNAADQPGHGEDECRAGDGTGHHEIAAAFPVFRDIPVVESWGGMIDVMPDAIPVISAVDRVPGFFIATGFSGHGFGIGPGAGRLVADMVAGGATIVDPSPFRLSRFTDGSNPRPHPLAS